jgi:hypothetical protein
MSNLMAFLSVCGGGSLMLGAFILIDKLIDMHINAQKSKRRAESMLAYAQEDIVRLNRRMTALESTMRDIDKRLLALGCSTAGRLTKIENSIKGWE